jgi:hypothetical protein
MPSKTFLRGSDIEKMANELIKRATSVRVAIAYWGRGSYDWLDTESIAARDTTIVCDLMSGAHVIPARYPACKICSANRGC